MAAIIIQIKLYLPEVHSLKEKRGVLKSLLTKIHQRYNTSCAELDYMDVWQTSKVGFALISNDYKVLQSSSEKIKLFITHEFPGLVIVEEDIEFF
jgi:uncharacterized protein YlxP (DUF503 family)